MELTVGEEVLVGFAVVVVVVVGVGGGGGGGRRCGRGGGDCPLGVQFRKGDHLKLFVRNVYRFGENGNMA
jgi:hypothetical protein